MHPSPTFLSLSVVFPLRLQHSRNTHRSYATPPIPVTERSVSAGGSSNWKSCIWIHHELYLINLFLGGALKKIVALVLMVLLMLPAVLPAGAAAGQEEAVTVRLLVELVRPTGSWQDTRALREALITVRRITIRAPRSYVAGGQYRRARDLRRWRVVEVEAAAVERVIDDLSASPAVASVRKVHIYEAAVEPNDPRFSEQYGLSSTVEPLADINAPAAWDKTTGSSDTIIAIVDGGVDLTHEDLVDKIWLNEGEIPGNGIDDDDNGFVDDVHGWDFVSGRPAGVSVKHATHVAGIAAASSNNNLGVTGVDWGARIMSVRVLNAGGFGFEDNIISGINYAVDNGAKVINMSLVGSASEAMLAAIENAYAAGVVVVAAAGNRGLDTGRFARYPVCADVGGVDMVLGVAATGEDGTPWRKSNYGACVNVSAPGDDIMSTKTGDRYGEMSGTSMATPFAAGVAGLYLALHPGASAAEIIEAVSNGTLFTGEDADEWNAKYRKRLNAAATLGATEDGVVTAVQQQPPLSPAAPSSEGDSGGDGGGGGGDGGDGGGGESGQQPDTPRVAAVQHRANSALLARVKDTFRYVFGRLPMREERAYWSERIRLGHKRTYAALLGAMRWQRARGWTAGPQRSARVAGAVSGDLVPRINALHRQAYGRNPTASEHTYWLGRVVRSEKTSEAALIGAMIYQRLAGIRH